MRIHHLIAGRPVESARYFETVNPATQEVLAEASGVLKNRAQRFLAEIS